MFGYTSAFLLCRVTEEFAFDDFTTRADVKAALNVHKILIQNIP